MRLVVHGYRLEGHQTGVARYLRCLLKQWDHNSGPFSQVRVHSRLHKDDARWPLHRKLEHVSLVPWLPYVVCEQLLLRWCARADVLFCPANTMPVGYRGPCVVTMHDTLQEVLPKTFPWWARWRHAPLYRHSARRATLVLTVSESSKRDVMRFYGVPEEKIRVIHLAPDAAFRLPPASDRVVEARSRLACLNHPYVLFVGKLSLRRNVPELLRAFGAFLQRSQMPHRLVLVGANHLRLPLDQWIAEAGVEGRVTHLPHVSDEDLAVLYHKAECLVLPSSYEGFGLPIVEAMACGCPVVTFRNSSLAEVGADAAYYCPTQDEEGIITAFDDVLTSAVLRAQLRERGLQRASQFSWERTASETLQALAEVAT